MIYWTLFPYDYNPSPSNINIKIHSDFKYEDTLDVWGYGKYGAPCYVYDGVIEMTSDGSISTIEKGVLKVGMNLNDSPMSYLNTDTARPDGFEAKVAEQVAEKLGLKLEIIDTTQKNLLKSLLF